MSLYSSNLANLGIGSALAETLESADSFRSALDRTAGHWTESAFASPLKELTAFETATPSYAAMLGTDALSKSMSSHAAMLGTDALSKSQSGYAAKFGPESALGQMCSANESMFGLESALGQMRSANEPMFGPESALGKARLAHESMFGSESALGKARLAHESMFGPESALGKARLAHESMFGPESALGQMRSMHESKFGPESALGEARLAHESMFGPESAVGKLRSAHDSLFGSESAVGKLRSAHDSLFGSEPAVGKLRSAHDSLFGSESAVGKLRSAHDSLFGSESALSSYTSMLGTKFAQAQSSFGSLFDQASAFEEFRKAQSGFALMFGDVPSFAKAGSVHASFFDGHTRTATSRGLRFGLHDPMQETKMLAAITDMYRTGLGGASDYGWRPEDLYRSGLDEYLTASTNLPTPVAFAAGRSGPTAPATLAIIRKREPEIPQRTVRAGLDVNVAEADAPSRCDSPSSGSVDMDLTLPAHLSIAVVTYCLENNIKMGRLVQEVLAGFFNLDPDEPPHPPKKERHLKLVK